MLHLNKDGNPDLTLAAKSDLIVWKVLIYDSKSEPVISSVLRVNDLLRCGITVHKPITAQRLALPDVPVIYFVEATPVNISKILVDLEQDRYESFYVNFTLSISRELLEEFAKKVSACGRGNKVKQVYDQFLDFVVTEPNLFLLDIPQVYSLFNYPGATEDQIHELAGKIANGVMASLVTMGVVPIIRCPQKGPAELVATQLDMKLREYVSNWAGQGSQPLLQRPVLLILDRNLDMASMFLHSWIYQCMVSDVFYLRRNRIKITKYDSANGPQQVQYDVDPRDFFWLKNSQLPFPDVVENADQELGDYKREAELITSKTGASEVDLNATNDLLGMKEGVGALHEMRARKITLDMHMDVLALLLKELEARSLDKFFEIEQNYADPVVQAEFMQLLKSDAVRPNEIDKLRTFLILNLLGDLPSAFVNQCVLVFSEKYPDLDMNAFLYVTKLKHMHQLLKAAASANAGDSGRAHTASGANESNSALFNGLSSKLYGFTEGRISEGISSLASGLKKLLPDKKNLPITNIVEAVMDPGLASSGTLLMTDDYLYLDPKSRGGHTKPPKRQSYLDAMVFVVGGGNNLEYHNLTEWACQPNNQKKVVYGSTDIVTAKEFLDEISQLGKLE